MCQKQNYQDDTELCEEALCLWLFPQGIRVIGITYCNLNGGGGKCGNCNTD